MASIAEWESKFYMYAYHSFLSIYHGLNRTGLGYKTGNICVSVSTVHCALYHFNNPVLYKTMKSKNLYVCFDNQKRDKPKNHVYSMIFGFSLTLCSILGFFSLLSLFLLPVWVRNRERETDWWLLCIWSIVVEAELKYNVNSVCKPIHASKAAQHSIV